jgi:hypothetical protein
MSAFMVTRSDQMAGGLILNLGLIMARQQGKSTLMMLRILTGMFVWGEGLQLASAHRLTTSLETFRQIVGLIETNPRLEKEVKKIRWQHGAEEIELFGNRRFVVKAANNAARGLVNPKQYILMSCVNIRMRMLGHQCVIP